MTALAWANIPAVGVADTVRLREAAVEIAAERRRRSAPLSAVRSRVRDAAVPVWVLPSRRAGDATQAMALAEGLGLPFTVKQLAWRPVDLLRAPPFAATLAGLEPEAAASLKAPWPTLVLSAGCENEPVARWIPAGVGRPEPDRPCRPAVGPARRLRPRRDHAAVPAARAAERAPERGAVAPRHRDRLAEAVAAWKTRLRHLPRPYFAVLVGGGSGPYPLDRQAGERLGRQASELARRHGGSLLITTSARTPASALAGLASALDAPHYLFGWKKGRAENPYYAFLGLAEEIVVTADSVSMIAEACATAKPVHLFDLGEGPLSMRAPLGLDGEPEPALRPDPRRWLAQSGLSTAMYRLLLRHAPAWLTRDIRLVHRRFVASGRACWLGEAAPAAVRPPLCDLDRAVARVRALLAGSDIERVTVLDRAA